MNKYYCPVCGSESEKFLDFNAEYTGVNPELCADVKNMMCPVCYSLPRHRLLAWHLQERELPKGILIAGSDGYLKRFFARKAIGILTVDVSGKDADMRADLQDLPFADESWNMILSIHVLEHVLSLDNALKELRRVLKPDGQLLLCVPKQDKHKNTFEDESFDYKKRIKYMGQADHLRIFGRDFETILANSGFAVDVVDGDGAPENIRAVTGPMVFDENKIYVCRKEGVHV